MLPFVNHTIGLGVAVLQWQGKEGESLTQRGKGAEEGTYRRGPGGGIKGKASPSGEGENASLFQLARANLWAREAIMSPFQGSPFCNRHFFSGRCPELY